VKSSTSDSDGFLYGYFKAVPSGAFSAVVKCRNLNIVNGGGWKACGLAVVNSTNGKSVFFMRNGVGSPNIYMAQFTSGGGYASGSPVNQDNVTDQSDYMHLDFDGTDTITLSLSQDGVNKLVWKTYSATTYLGGAPQYVGPGWSGQATANAGPVYGFTHFYAGAAGANGL
jgi:hypothetical protein